jgi:hypothetical protein
LSNFGFLKALIYGEAKCFPKYIKRGGHHRMKSPTEFFRVKAAREWRTPIHFGVLSVAACVALADNVFAQTAGNSPWENAVQVLQTAFTGPIATGLALVAIVVGGVPEGCLGGRHDAGPNLLPWPSSNTPSLYFSGSKIRSSLFSWLFRRNHLSGALARLGTPLQEAWEKEDSSPRNAPTYSVNSP